MKESEKYKDGGQFPVSVTISEFERIKAHNESATEPDAKVFTNDAQLFDRLQQVYKAAVEEENIPINECKCPAVIIAKYAALSQQEKDSFAMQLLEAVEQREEEIRKRLKRTKPENYDQSFGGTEADSKNEKEAALLLRGSTAVAEESNPLLRPPNISNSFENIELRRVGRWLKYFGASGCYMYIHNLSREVLSIRPEDYIEEASQEVAASIDATAIDPANGLPRVDLQDLPAEVDRIVKELASTPLIIDQSPENTVRTFYEYKAMLEVLYLRLKSC